jgi:hypothetical protein
MTSYSRRIFGSLDFIKVFDINFKTIRLGLQLSI